jgi:hypothetical protein
VRFKTSAGEVYLNPAYVRKIVSIEPERSLLFLVPSGDVTAEAAIDEVARAIDEALQP